MRICLDPGHGGRDSGAIAQGLKEKDLNMELTYALTPYLINAGHVIKRTRTQDIKVSLGRRCRISNDWEAELFISLHHNSASNPRAEGFEVLYYPHNMKGHKLAQRLCDAVCSKWPIANRGAKQGWYRGRVGHYLPILQNTHAMAILIEAGFISSEVDRQKSIGTPEKRAEFYKVISNSIVEVI